VEHRPQDIVRVAQVVRVVIFPAQVKCRKRYVPGRLDLNVTFAALALSAGSRILPLQPNQSPPVCCRLSRNATASPPAAGLRGSAVRFETTTRRLMRSFCYCVQTEVCSPQGGHHVHSRHSTNLIGMCRGPHRNGASPLVPL
jgi:hypothetical protein